MSHVDPNTLTALALFQLCLFTLKSTSDTMRKQVQPLREICSQTVEHVIRKACGHGWDPKCQELEALGSEQKKRGIAIRDFVEEVPASAIEEILQRVLAYDGDPEAKASPMDVWTMVHPLAKTVIYAKQPRLEPVRNSSKALLESIHRCKYLETLDLAGLKTTGGIDSDFQTRDSKEFYLSVLKDALQDLSHLVFLNVSTFADNSICKALSENCSNLRELHMEGDNGVSDLGLKYIIGRIPSVRDDDSGSSDVTKAQASPGCLKLQVLSLKNMPDISLRCLVVLILHLLDLKVLDHERLHEAITLMERTDMMPQLGPLQLTSYHGRTLESCATPVLEVVQKLCPKLELVHLITTFEDTFMPLARLREVRSLTLERVETMENFDLPLMAFGSKLLKLELKACHNFQSGTALNIRRFCPNLRTLILEIDSTASSKATSEAEETNNPPTDGPEQNIWVLQNQVDDLQTKLNKLQVTMLSVMDKYGPMTDLEAFQVRNMTMGSILILLPYMPNVKVLSFNYTRQAEDSACNLTDDLFKKIFQKNDFKHLEHLSIWSRSVGSATADWLIQHAPKLKTFQGISRWEIPDEEKLRIWRDGRHREPEIDIGL